MDLIIKTEVTTNLDVINGLHCFKTETLTLLITDQQINELVPTTEIRLDRYITALLEQHNTPLLSLHLEAGVRVFF